MLLRMCPDCGSVDITINEIEGAPVYFCCQCWVSWEQNSRYDNWAKTKYTQKVMGREGI